MTIGSTFPTLDTERIQKYELYIEPKPQPDEYITITTATIFTNGYAQYGDSIQIYDDEIITRCNNK